MVGMVRFGGIDRQPAGEPGVGKRVMGRGGDPEMGRYWETGKAVSQGLDLHALSQHGDLGSGLGELTMRGMICSSMVTSGSGIC